MEDFDKLDDDLFNVDDTIDDEGDGKRKPVSSKIKKTGKDFLEDFKHTPVMDQAKEVGEGFISSAIGDDAINAVKDAQQAIADSTKELRKSSSDILKNIADKSGDDSLIGKAADKIAKLLYTDTSTSSTRTGPSDDELAANFSKSIFGENKQAQDAQARMLALQSETASKDTKKIIESQLALFNLNKYGISLSERYYRQSIELKYRHILEAKKQTGLLATEFNNVLLKLSNIEHNTMLPDLIKMKSSEVLKARAMSNVMDSIYKPITSSLNRAGVYDFIRSKLDNVVGGIQSGLGMASMAGSMGGDLGISAGSMAASFGRSGIGSILGKKLLQTKWGREYVNTTDAIKLSPEGFLRNYADKFGTDTGIGKFLSGVANFITPEISDLSRLNVNREDLNEPTALDVRTKESINIVPTLLGNILQEVKALRTHTEPSEVKYDHLKQEFIPVKETRKKLFSDITTALTDVGTAKNMEEFFKSVDEESSVKLSDKEKGKLTRRLYRRIDDPSFSLAYIKEDDPIFRNLSKDEKEKFYTYLTSAQKTKGKLDAGKSRVLTEKLRNVNETRININKRLEELIASGFGKELEEAGFVTLDRKTGRYYLNRDIVESITASRLSKILGAENTGPVRDEGHLKEQVSDFVKNSTNQVSGFIKTASARTSAVLTPIAGETKEKVSSFMQEVKNRFPQHTGEFNVYYSEFKKDPKAFYAKYGEDLYARLSNIQDTDTYKNIASTINPVFDTAKQEATLNYNKIQSLVEKYKASPEDIITLSKEFNLSIDEIRKLYEKSKDIDGASIKDELKQFFSDKEKKRKLGDTDGDGVREGSWLEILKNKKDKEKAAKDFSKNIKKNDKRSGGVLGLIGGLIATLFGGVGLGASVLKTLGGSIFKPITKLMSDAVFGGLNMFMPKNLVTTALRAIVSIPKMMWRAGMAVRAGKNAVFSTVGRGVLSSDLGGKVVSGLAGGIGGITGAVVGGYLTDKYFHMSAAEHDAVKDFNNMIRSGYSLEQADSMLQKKYGLTLDDLKTKISLDKYSGLADIGGSLAGWYVGTKALGWGADKLFSRTAVKGAEQAAASAAKSGWMSKAGNFLLKAVTKFGGKGGKVGALIAGLGLLATYLIGGDEFDKDDIKGAEELKRKYGKPLTESERAQQDLRELGYMVPPNRLADKLMADYTGKKYDDTDSGNGLLLAGMAGGMGLVGYGAHKVRKGSWRSIVPDNDFISRHDPEYKQGMSDAKRERRKAESAAKKIANNAKQSYSLSGIMKFLPKKFLKYGGKLGGVLKKLPFVGTAVSLGSAAMNLAKGNYGGAAMDVISSMAKMSPIGMALSLASIFLPFGDDDKKKDKRKTGGGKSLQEQLDDWKNKVGEYNKGMGDKLYYNSKGELKPLSEMTTEELNKTKAHKGESGIRHYSKMMHENDKRREWGKLTKNANLFAMMKSGKGMEVEPNFHGMNGAQRIRAKKEYEETRRKTMEEFFPDEVPPSAYTANMLKMKTLGTWEVTGPVTRGRNGAQRAILQRKWEANRRSMVSEYGLDSFGNKQTTSNGVAAGLPKGKLIVTYTHPERGDWRNHMDPATVKAAEYAFREWNRPVTITSAYRSRLTNKRVHGAKHSMHTEGKALDLEVSRWTRKEICAFIKIAGKYGFRGFGVYGENPSMLHIDTGGKRMWGANFHRSSLPSWAAPCINAAHNNPTDMSVVAPLHPDIIEDNSVYDDSSCTAVQVAKQLPAISQSGGETCKTGLGANTGSSSDGFSSAGSMESGSTQLSNGNADSGNLPSGESIIGNASAKNGVKSNRSVSNIDKILLDAIAKNESGGYPSNNGGYDVAFGGKRYLHGADPSKMTISEVYKLQRRIRRETANTRYPTSAIGRYQFMYNTLKDTVRRSGISENTIFSPNVQDWLIVQRLNQVRGYKRWKAGKISDKEFAFNLSQEFASIANPYTGKGNYKHQKGKTTYADLKEAFDKMRGLGVDSSVSTTNNGQSIDNSTPGISRAEDNDSTAPSSTGFGSKIDTGFKLVGNIIDKAKDVNDSLTGTANDLPIMLKTSSKNNNTGIPAPSDILGGKSLGSSANTSNKPTILSTILDNSQEPVVGELKGSNKQLSELNRKMEILIKEIRGSNQTIKKAVEKPKVVHTREVIHDGKSHANNKPLDALNEPNVRQIDIASTSVDSEDFSRLY